MKHGTLSAYMNHKCRCELCRQANAEWQYNARLKRLQTGLAADDPRHGTNNGYTNFECRCAACTEAHRKAHR